MQVIQIRNHRNKLVLMSDFRSVFEGWIAQRVARNTTKLNTELDKIRECPAQIDLERLKVLKWERAELDTMKQVVIEVANAGTSGRADRLMGYNAANNTLERKFEQYTLIINIG